MRADFSTKCKVEVISRASSIVSGLFPNFVLSFTRSVRVAHGQARTCILKSPIARFSSAAPYTAKLAFFSGAIGGGGVGFLDGQWSATDDPHPMRTPSPRTRREEISIPT